MLEPVFQGVRLYRQLAVRPSAAFGVQHGMAQFSTAQHGIAWHGTPPFYRLLGSTSTCKHDGLTWVKGSIGLTVCSLFNGASAHISSHTPQQAKCVKASGSHQFKPQNDTAYCKKCLQLQGLGVVCRVLSYAPKSAKRGKAYKQLQFIIMVKTPSRSSITHLGMYRA